MAYYKSDYISLTINKMKYMDSHLKAIFLYKIDDHEIVNHRNYFNTITESHKDYNMCIICRDIYNTKFKMFYDFVIKNNLIISDHNWNIIWKTMRTAITRNNRSYMYIISIKNKNFFHHVIYKTIYKDLPLELKSTIYNFI